MAMDCGQGQGLLTSFSSSPRLAHNQSDGGNLSVEFPLLRYVKVTTDAIWKEEGGTSRRGVSEGNKIHTKYVMCMSQ